MSLLQRSGLSLPIEATMAAEFLWTGHLETSAFQGLSAGKICIAETTASASLVLKSVGLSTLGGASTVKITRTTVGQNMSDSV